MVSTLQRLGVFATSGEVRSASLQNIATKDLATEEIQNALLVARQLDQQQVDTFIKEQLVVTEAGSNSLVSSYAPLPRNNGPTFSALYHVSKNTKEKNKKEQ